MNLNWFLRPPNPLSYITLNTLKEAPPPTSARPETTTHRATHPPEFYGPIQFPIDRSRRPRSRINHQSEELGDFWWERLPGQTTQESTTQAAEQAPATPTEEELEEGISCFH